MDKRTLTALKGSIKKWELIVEQRGTDQAWRNCPLCQLFCRPPDRTCAGCPVKERTGFSGCIGTPYERFTRWSVDLCPNKRVLNNYAASEKAILAAQAEVEFLRSLLPKNATGKRLRWYSRHETDN